MLEKESQHRQQFIGHLVLYDILLNSALIFYNGTPKDV